MLLYSPMLVFLSLSLEIEINNETKNNITKNQIKCQYSSPEIKFCINIVDYLNSAKFTMIVYNSVTINDCCIVTLRKDAKFIHNSNVKSLGENKK